MGLLAAVGDYGLQELIDEARALLANRGFERQVATYADMLALGTPTSITTVLVVNDENRSDTYQLYKIYPSGKRMYVLSLEDS